jgi:hypothetical protein
MKNTNGNLPAMPVTYKERYNAGYDYAFRDVCHQGLTKRERFAMAMAQGILSNSSNCMSHCARDAVMMADELLAELERTA